MKNNGITELLPDTQNAKMRQAKYKKYDKQNTKIPF